MNPPKVFESRYRAKEGSMVVPTVRDTGEAASSMLELLFARRRIRIPSRNVRFLKQMSVFLIKLGFV